MQVGDIVRITCCDDEPAGIGMGSCSCWLCCGNSNRLGLVTEYLGSNDDEPRFNVRFDIGHWTVFDADITRGSAEVISEAGER
jgi:hypothetical protein